jgi:hypothetical protein
LKSEIAVVVMSTDSYEDVWDHFFYYFDKYWPDCSYPKYLICENKSTRIKNVTTLNQVGSTWSHVLQLALSRLSHKYIILILDDMFLCEPVNNDFVLRAIDFITQENNICCVRLGGNDNTRLTAASNYDGFSIVSHDSPFRVTTSPTIWVRDQIITLLHEDESPWEFEINGTERSKTQCGPLEFFDLNPAAIFTYSTWIADTAIIRGKWQYDAVKMIEHDGRKVYKERRGISFKTRPVVSILVKTKRFIIYLWSKLNHDS